jgi:two-component system response regulator AtoC
MADRALKETKDNPNILIIDGNPSILAGMEKGLRDLGFDLCCTAAPNSPIDQLHELNADLAILGPSLDSKTSLRCLHKLRIIDPVVPILTSCDDYMSGGSSTCPFEGVYSLSADLDLEEISKAIQKALRYRLECKFQPDFQLLIGQSQEMENIRSKIHKVCDKDITVLITGETGTGKELIARSIHYHSRRSKGPLVKVNCSALPDELLESEVFGFQKGAFTGAYRDKPGRLEMANGGTLFIDEIGNLSLSLQVKFLQVLEDRSFSRLGGTEDRIVDTRVVAATNTDLAKKVRDDTFRKDLFYRLNVVPIEAPPLRGRSDDIPLLTDYFLNKYCFEFRKDCLEIPRKIADLFLIYQWPGNVRELENVIRRAIILRNWDFIFKELNLENLKHDSEDVLLSDDTSHPLVWQDDKVRRFFRDSDFSLKKISNAYVSEAERQAILKALKQTQWNRKKAAELLRVSYKTLLNRIFEFDLKP